MRITSALRVVLRGRGQPQWMEVRNPKLPEGFKIFDYSPKYYASLICFFGMCTYAMLQSDLNPESVWAKMMKMVNAATGSVSDTVNNATGNAEYEKKVAKKSVSSSGSTVDWLKTFSKQISENISNAAGVKIVDDHQVEK